jgi:putative mRNA 3-end processing factor
MHNLLELRPEGLYCAEGDFYIDPWQPVQRAVITHAHSDRARAGSQSYLCAQPGEDILRAQLGETASIQSVPYRESINFGPVSATLFPAGHMLGSAQVKIARNGYSWVVSGDYKTAEDPTCAAFEPIRCNGFVTEATFALPIYRWSPAADTFDQINAWWRENRDQQRSSLLYVYPLGKAQRLLAGIDASIGPIHAHDSIDRFNQAYRRAGIPLPKTINMPQTGALILAPPGMTGRYGKVSTALASGWMQVRGHRRRRAVDRGFVLADHADWPGLLDAVKATGAETIWVTHGYVDPLVHWLREQGVDATGLTSHFENDEDAA